MICETCSKLMTTHAFKKCLKCDALVPGSIYTVCETCAKDKCQSCLKQIHKKSDPKGCFGCSGR